jgi:hypothetical protein
MRWLIFTVGCDRAIVRVGSPDCLCKCFPGLVGCTRYSQYIANLCKSTIDGHKNNSTMVSDASLGTATPKMNKSFVHMAHVSSDRACAQDGYLKRPHRTIIDGDMMWDSGWFLGGLGVGGHWTHN